MEPAASVSGDTSPGISCSEEAGIPRFYEAAGVFNEDDLPELEEMDIRGDLGGIRELIRDYIIHAESGVLTPECSQNWRIVIP